MGTQPHVSFNDGRSIPQLGLGVWQTPDDVAVEIVSTALKTGYRHIDTAAVYKNEEGVGKGIVASGIDRGDIFLTTKVWNEDQGFDETLRAMDASLKRLGTDYVDLYLIHWPSAFRGKYIETWKALIRLREEGKVKSIGVSNFEGTYIDDLIRETGVTPAINQIQLHPRFQQQAMRDKHAGLGVVTESWSPLGQGNVLADPVIGEIAKRHGKSPAQVIIRWHLDLGLVVIPKSATPSRIVENFEVFDFALSEEDKAAIAGLDTADGRIGSDPMSATF
ncbi:2,5-diketo-D-gluconate reductase A [Devosia subaequoris]|uniref:2,5-diketo-D-gluconate reductase A n=1 Tax=Devosia subaequoris TaxID=395930 RepID=A0A7W6INJ3_9HYPH|nr:aldo/keto reductase [Devosia subaequoris]MBB4052830.1 2,5-diketo-D-gluconate reductase A [Devosia subaequoris]MCP1209981.1 aldo/keto reductase [Devosia subaequoris]